MVSYYNDVLSDSKLTSNSKINNNSKIKHVSLCASTKYSSRICGKKLLTYQELLLFITCTIIVISWCCNETAALPAPSSPWNQAGLNLIFKTDLHEKNPSKGKNSLTNTDEAKEKGGSTDKAHTNGNSIPSHSWGYTRYGHGQGIGHFRHANRRHFVPNNKSVPCPRDYIRLYNGKCRKIPSFTSSRVG